MIRLHHLRAENFKVLREVGLIFPAAGSILVEGLNESGKSTLFESIYFALYGRPLVSEGTIDSVVRYGAAEAQVELALSVEETELLIERQVRPGRPGRARLLIRRPGGYEEEVTRLSAIVERVVAELGGLDGETLLNSCFVEQKKLQRLESLDAAARRAALLRLLNLDSLGQLENRFKLNRQDDQALRAAEARRDLAQLRARLPELVAEAARVERRLVARRIAETLARAAQLETAQAEQWVHRLTIDRRLTELDAALERAGAVRRAAQAERSPALAPILAGWVDARAEVERAKQAEQEHDATTSTLDLQRARVTGAHANVTVAGRRRVAAFALALVGTAAGAGMLAFDIFPLGLLPLLVAMVALLVGLSSAHQLSRLRHDLTERQRELDETQQRALTLAGTIAAFGDGPGERLTAAAQRLTALGAPLPDDLAAGRAALEAAEQLANLDYTKSYGDPADPRAALAAERRQLDERGTRATLAELVEERGKTEANLAHLAADLATTRATVANLLDSLDPVTTADPTNHAAVVAVLPEVDQADLPAEAELDQQRDRLLAELGYLHREGERLEAAWGLAGVTLDLDTCQSELELAGRERAIKQRATTILTMARTSMVGRVLPTTEQNLRLLLPRLTDQRYHDATLSEDYRLEVWDAEAGRYVAKDIFSGGARDQFSLALRLAFALATLPQELGTTPGFIFLDEPLSAFDSPRTDALVDLLTTGQIARSFAQIFLISHSRTFDPALFPYYLRMQAGRVAETNLAQL